MRGLSAASLVVVLAVTAGWLWLRAQIGLDERVANTTSTLSTTPLHVGDWTLRPVFEGVRLHRVTRLVTGPDGHLYVLEQDGRIVRLPRDPGQGEALVWLDVTDATSGEGEGGLLGLAFHPDHGRADAANGDAVYVWYSARTGGARTNRLSRFEIAPGGARALPETEQILIDQEDEHRWHDGGGLAFGPDGFLYVALGDEGHSRDSFENSQTISKDLFSGVIRIDVDRRLGDVSHPPRRAPRNGRTAHYAIPSDNPFVGVPDALEEFWALGLRNPNALTFDETTGMLVVTDVGQNDWEEINVVRPGGNHQWAYREADMPIERNRFDGRAPAALIGTEQPPRYAYPHLHGDKCVIGGVVYRGARHPELDGRYVFGDLTSGRIWALALDAEGPASRQTPRLLTQLVGGAERSLVSITADRAGRLFAATHAGSILRLEPRAVRPVASRLPARLSETGVFQDLASLAPAPGFVPYEVNAPLWSDGAIKRRWISVPGDGTSADPSVDRILFDAEGPWTFPAGTLFVKHFELALDADDPARRRRLETRLLVRDDAGGIHGVTYRWNEEGSDAFLLDGRFEEMLPVDAASADGRPITWTYPSRADCLTCHTAQAGHILGVNTRQLNRRVTYPETGRSGHQLMTWNAIGMLSRKASRVRRIDLHRFFMHDRLVDPADPRATLDDRVLSYLDANCANCHRPYVSRSPLDLRWGRGEADRHLVDVVALAPTGDRDDARLLDTRNPLASELLARMSSRDPAHRMPPLATTVPDPDAIELVRAWLLER